MYIRPSFWLAGSGRVDWNGVLVQYQWHTHTCTHTHSHTKGIDTAKQTRGMTPGSRPD